MSYARREPKSPIANRAARAPSDRWAPENAIEEDYLESDPLGTACLLTALLLVALVWVPALERIVGYMR